MAGKGTRMAKHYEGPKHLLPVNGKPVIEHLLESLPKEVKELIFVVGGPHEDTIRDYFKAGEHDGRPISFVRQEEQLGVAHAFWQAKDLITDKWLGILPDDLYGPDPFSKLLKHEAAILGYRVEHPETFGVLVTDKDDNLEKAVEKPQEFVSDLVWVGAMLMPKSFMETEVPPSGRGEYEVPDVWMKLMETGEKIKVVETDFWMPINSKEQLEAAEAALNAE